MIWTNKQVEELRRSVNHLTVREIAELMGRTKYSIYNKCIYEGIDYQTERKTDEDRALARALRKEGLTLREIAEKLETTRQTIYRWTR